MYVIVLSYSQAPLVSPLHKPTRIEMYNEMYFQPIKVSVNRSSEDEASKQFDSEALKWHQNEPKIFSTTELFQEADNDLLISEEIEIK